MRRIRYSPSLLNAPSRLIPAKLVERTSRFTVDVRVRNQLVTAYLPNPGALRTVLAPGRKLLLVPKAEGLPYAVYAAKLPRFWVTLWAAQASNLFAAALQRGIFKELYGWRIEAREVRVPQAGRLDFVLRRKQQRMWVEVKSCTHVEADGTGKFPDRPSERARRHLRFLIERVHQGERALLVFVVQRPDAERMTGFREVDPKFADLLNYALDEGVAALAFSTRFRLRPRGIFFEKRVPVVRG